MVFRACSVGLLLLLAACAVPMVEREKPEAQITSFEVLPSEGLAPRFGIGLHVINPTWLPLEIEGMTYHVEVDGHMILSGVEDDLPRIDAYGEADVFIEVSMDVFNSLRLLNEVLRDGRETLTYYLNAKLDVGVLRPSIRIHKTGEIRLKSPE